MFAFEAVRARFGDSLLRHYGTEEDPKLVVIDGGPDRARSRATPRAIRSSSESIYSGSIVTCSG